MYISKTSKTTMSIAEAEKKSYDNLGYTKIPQFFSREYIDHINRAIDELDVQVRPTVFDEDGTGKIKQIQYLHTRSDVFKDMLERIRPSAEVLTDTKMLSVLNMQMFEKHPQLSKPTRAHQDNAYFQLSPATALTVWIALDDIDEENGCLYYTSGSHSSETIKHDRYHKNTTFRCRSGVPGLSMCIKDHDESMDIPMPCNKGDVLIHNCNTIHRAGKNVTIDRRRRAIGIVFIPDDCQKDPRLVAYHKEQLEEDIGLQKERNPELYKQLKNNKN